MMFATLFSTKKDYTKTLAVRIAGVMVGMLLYLPVTMAMGKVTIMVKNPDPYLGNHSRFIYEKKPGTMLEDVALLKNVGDEPVSISLNAVDAVANENGSFLLSFAQEEQKSIGKWTTIEKKLVTINPGESLDVPFRIAIPADADPGQYLGGIVVEEVKTLNSSKISNTQAGIDATEAQSCGSDKTSCSQNITVKSRVGSRIYLTVPGSIEEDVSVSNFSTSKTLTGTTVFNFTVENKGNVAYEPQVTIEVYDQRGHLYEKVTGSIGTSLPGSTVHGSLKMKQHPLFGQFTAKAFIQYERKFNSSSLHGAPLTDTLSLKFWVMPWEILTLFMLVLLGIMAIHWQRIRAYQNFMTQSEDYVVQPEENLLLLAVKHRISWKKLAKYNSLKPPYIVSAGQKIRVPHQLQ